MREQKFCAVDDRAQRPKTETLSIAAVLWVFASLLRSINNGRFHFAEIGVACVVGIFIRYDFILILFPVAAAAFFIHPWRPAAGSVLA